MHNFLAQFSVKVKVISGFAFILSILAVVAVFVLVSSKHIERTILHVVGVTIPVQFKSMKLKSYIDQSSGNLGFYLLGKDEHHWNSFNQNLDDAMALLMEMKAELNDTQILNSDSAKTKQQ